MSASDIAAVCATTDRRRCLAAWLRDPYVLVVAITLLFLLLVGCATSAAKVRRAAVRVPVVVVDCEDPFTPRSPGFSPDIRSLQRVAQSAVRPH